MIADLKPYTEYRASGLPWLGPIPAHWEIRRLKSVVKNVISPTLEIDPDEVYVALEHVEGWTGKAIPQLGLKLFTGQVKRFQQGDVLFGKLRPYLAKVTRIRNNGVCAGEFFVLRPTNAGVDAAFVEHHLRAKHTIEVINGSTFGAKMPRADWQFCGNLPFPFPLPAEQAAIVRFLDWANGRLERAIRAKRKVIALLNEQKQAIIHRAVTRGLDPSVPLKPSGIPWLGDIPQHWQLWRISRLARVGNGSTPSRAKPHYWNGGTYPWLNSSQVNRRFINSADQFVTQAALRECHLPRVPASSVLVAITGQGKTRGMSAVLGIEATINQHIAYITPGTTVTTAEYIHVVLSAAYRQLRASSEDSGSTKGAITCEALKRFPLAIPPMPEQIANLDYIEAETSSVSTALERLQQEVTLLHEYRTRLVADVVTGKLDVREAAARLPDQPTSDADDAPEPIDEDEPTDEEVTE